MTVDNLNKKAFNFLQNGDKIYYICVKIALYMPPMVAYIMTRKIALCMAFIQGIQIIVRLDPTADTARHRPAAIADYSRPAFLL
jgi:hypothetical protein